ncbi:MAG: hypothetical protein FWD38_09210 [Oscillospiraceae bacterium]|nr:hypothetical protein [Oscillospiraceae bacterium]
MKKSVAVIIMILFGIFTALLIVDFYFPLYSLVSNDPPKNTSYIASVYNHIINNFEVALITLFFLILPVVLIISIIVFIVLRVKKIRIVNFIVISDYAYKTFMYDGNRTNETAKQRIEAVLNSYYKVNNRYWR